MKIPFYYWAQLLDFYRNDKTVGHIGSVCSLRSQQPTKESYFFSKYAHVWGWATWRRAWLLYDAHLENLPQAEEKGILSSIHNSNKELRFWREKLWKCKLGAIDTWDYQWNFSLWWHGLKSITPFQNHTENIGFDPEGATHTTQKELPWYAELKAISPPKSLQHPKNTFYQEDLDKETFVNMHLESSRLLNLFKDLKKKVLPDVS